MAKAISRKKISGAQQTSVVKFWQSRNFTGWLVFGVAFLLYANSIPAGYNMDDELVTRNQRLTSKGISAIPEIFISPYYHDESGYSYEYRPLVLASFAIEHQFFGDNAHVSHFFNVILYALCCLVLLKVLLKLFKNYSPLLSVAVTLLFIVHPAHTEVVCSIKNRDEILSLLFALLTLAVTLKGIETSNKWWLVLTPVMFTLALWGKITIISFAIIIPLALILFTDAGLGLIMLLTFLLIVPSFFLLNVTGSEKVLGFTGVFGLVLIFYAILNFKYCLNVFTGFASRIWRNLFRDRGPENRQISERGKITDIRELFTGIKPEKNLFSITAVILPGFLAAVYWVCITQFHSLVGIIPMALLLVLAWRGTESISWWAQIMIGLCLTCNIFFYENIWSLVAVYLVFQMYYGARNLFIPSLIFFILLNGITIFIYRDLAASTIPMILFLSYRYFGFAVISLITISLLTSITAKYAHHWIELVINITIFIFGIALLSRKYLTATSWLLLISALCLFHIVTHDTDREIHIPVRQAITAITSVSNQLNPEFIAKRQNRPMNYGEDCVDQSSPLSVRIGTSFEILLLYLGKVVFPYHMSFYYGPNVIYPQKMNETMPIISFILYFLIFATAVFSLTRARIISFALLIYLVSVGIFSNFLIPVSGMFADRFLLVPSLGWSLIVVVILFRVFKADYSKKTMAWNVVPRYARYVFAAILLLYGGMSFSRNMDWYDDITLMRHDIVNVPQSVQANNLLGIHLLKKANTVTSPDEQRQLIEEALGHIEKAYSIFPGYFNFSYDIGRCFILLNAPDSALVYFKKAYVLNPGFPDVAVNVANIYFTKGDYTASIPYFVKAIELTPGDFSLSDKLSYAYYNTNQIELSVKTNEDAVKRLPTRMEPYINIATCYIKNNMRDSALIWLNKALAVSPGNASIMDYMRNMK